MLAALLALCAAAVAGSRPAALALKGTRATACVRKKTAARCSAASMLTPAAVHRLQPLLINAQRRSFACTMADDNSENLQFKALLLERFEVLDGSASFLQVVGARLEERWEDDCTADRAGLGDILAGHAVSAALVAAGLLHLGKVCGNATRLLFQQVPQQG